jgi:hypothetical protein
MWCCALLAPTMNLKNMLRSPSTQGEGDLYSAVVGTGNADLLRFDRLVGL